MPELPEVETIARGLEQRLAGRRIRGVDVADPAVVHGQPLAQFSRRLAGRDILGVGRRGKLLVVQLSGPLVLAAHLRMTGRFVLLDEIAEPPRPRAVFHLVPSGDPKAPAGPLLFADTRRFGTLCALTPEELGRWPFYARMGPEPLDLDAEAFLARLKGPRGKRRARIKALLLDQTTIAGVGNIYADEALFASGIRPDRPAHRIADARLARLLEALQRVLLRAIAENGSSIRDYRDAGGDAGAFQNSFRVYGLAGTPCSACGSTLKRTTVAGRGTTYCPNCQT